MNQQINLYTKLDLQRAALVVFPIVVGVWLLLLAGYGAYAGYELYSQNKQSGLVKTLEAANEAVRRKIAEKTTVDYASELQRATTQVELVNKERVAKTRFVELLDHNQAGSKVPFSEFLTGLADQHVRGVAIEKISYKSGGEGGSAEFVMAGIVSDPEKVPLYLDRLGQTAAFEGMAFKKVMLAEADDEVSFEITSWTEL